MSNRVVQKTMWAVMGPIIAMPSYKDEPVPKEIMKHIKLQRLALSCDKDNTTASDAEAMWYISTVSLCQPLSHSWTTIYKYLTREFMLSLGHIPSALPEFLKDEIVMDESEKTELRKLKEWLYKNSMDAVKKRIKAMENEN